MSTPAERAAAYAEAALVEGMDASEAARFAVEATSVRSYPESMTVTPRDRTVVETGSGFLSLGAMAMRARAKPPTRWVVPGLLPGGVTLLGGPSKWGKSVLSLDIAFAVACGGLALGTLSTVAGSTIYLALEDTDVRIEQRLRSLEPDVSAWPLETMSLVTLGDMQGLGLRPTLDRWHGQTEDPSLVILDTLGSYRNLIAGTPLAQQAKGLSSYDADVALMRPLQLWAAQREVALLIVHHTNQTRWEEGDDWMTKISGTTGIVGTADNVMVVKGERGSREAALLATGRDLNDMEVQLQRVGLWWMATGGVVQ